MISRRPVDGDGFTEMEATRMLFITGNPWSGNAAFQFSRKSQAEMVEFRMYGKGRGFWAWTDNSLGSCPISHTNGRLFGDLARVFGFQRDYC
jgi:hypothetical protein